MKKLSLFLFIILSVNSFAQSKYNKLTEEGLQFLIQENIPAAINKYNEAYKIDSTKVEANYGLGTAYQFYCINRGVNCFTALKYLDKAIEADSTYRNGYYNRGTIKNTIKDYHSAISDFTKAITNKPKDADGYLSRSHAYHRLGNLNNECNDLKKAAALNNATAKKLLLERCK